MATEAYNSIVGPDGYLMLRGDPGPWIKNNPASRLLVRTLDLSLWGIDDVEEIGDSIGELTELISLIFSRSKSLKCLPNTITRLHNLERLKFSRCYLEELPSNLGQLKSLTHFSLSNCQSLTELPSNLGQLKSLTHFSLYYCNSLRELPLNLGQLKSLTHFSLSYCDSLTELPSNLGQLKSLTHFSLYYCNSLRELPLNLGQLKSLTHFSLFYCNSLRELPLNLGQLKSLTHFSLSYCDSLTELPLNLGQLKSLTHFSLFYCNSIKSLPNSMQDLCNLENLHIKVCPSLIELPVNLNVLHLKLYNCCIQFLPTGLINLKYLAIDIYTCSEKLLANLKDLVSLEHLVIRGCESSKIIKLPANLNQLIHLQKLSIKCGYQIVVELPANLDGLSQLCLVDIRNTRIQCLPWSITKLRKLRLLMLPEDFRLQTLPNQLNDLVIISVKNKHVRKSWQELKTEIRPLSFPDVKLEMAMNTVQHPSFISPPGYVRLTRDPWLWICHNYNSRKLVQFLELAFDEGKGNYIGSVEELSKLTHLYLSGCQCFPDNYFDTITRLRHLSLENCDKKSVFRSLSNDSLSKLSNLESLHLDLYNLQWPSNISLPVSLECLSLRRANMKSLHDCLAKLPNLKTLDLYACVSLDSLPANLYFAKVRLIHCFINDSKSLPTGLRHLEILDAYTKEPVTHECLNQLVNLETLSVTCHKIEFLPSIITGLRNLVKLELKDCFVLKKLPPNLDELVKLGTLDISGTRIKSLPKSIMKLHNLQHLILPKCFRLESLPGELKEVSVIDDTDEIYYKRMGYYDSCYEASTETFDEGDEISGGCIQEVDETVPVETEQGVVPGESCYEGDDIVSIVEVDEAVIAEQISAHEVSNNLNVGYSEKISAEQGVISEFHRGYNSLTEMLENSNVVDQRLKYRCSMQSLPKGLIKAKHLDISLCLCSKELLANLQDSLSLRHFAITHCLQHPDKELPPNVNELANLQTLSIECIHIQSLPSFAGLRNLQKLYLGGWNSRLEWAPADLYKLDELLVVDIHNTNIKCLPWSIMKLQKLKFLFLPREFRLETLPCELNESLVITIDCMHIRKTWKELKKEMGTSLFSGVGVEAAQNSSIIPSSGYLRWKEDPGPWIKNSGFTAAVRSLELESLDNTVKRGDSIGKLPKLTYLYISSSNLFELKHLPDTIMTLRHLSLCCNIESLSGSLIKLYNLESLCLDLKDKKLPDNMDLLVNLSHLSLEDARVQSLSDSVTKLSNLKSLDLYQCDLEFLPQNLNLVKLKLSDSSVSLLPSGLRHLEILHSKDECRNRPECDVTSLNLNQLVNLEKLSITCYSMESPPNIARLYNLQELQLKDCFRLEELPGGLDELVKLCALNISGTRIKSLPDSITKLHNLQRLILPKCFKQDSFHKYSRKGLTKVTSVDTDEMYFKDNDDDDDDDDDYDNEASMETSNEGSGKEPDSIEGINETFSKELEETISDEQTLPSKLIATQVALGDFCSDGGENSNPSDTVNRKGKIQKKEISLEMLQQCWSNNMTLVDAANKFEVSRSTMKRKLKELKIEWPSSRKGKQQQVNAKKRKRNISPIGNDSSQQNLVNRANPVAHTDNVTLSNHVSFTPDAVVFSTPETTMETIKEIPMETQCEMGCQQYAQAHKVSADECTLPNSLQQNECSSTFVVKATYKEDIVRFEFCLSYSIEQLKKEVGSRLELEVNTFKIKYQDEEKQLVLMTHISDLEHAMNLSRSSGSNVVRLSIIPKT